MRKCTLICVIVAVVIAILAVIAIVHVRSTGTPGNDGAVIDTGGAAPDNAALTECQSSLAAALAARKEAETALKEETAAKRDALAAAEKAKSDLKKESAAREKSEAAFKAKISGLESENKKLITLINGYRSTALELEEKTHAWEACFRAMLNHARELRRQINETNDRSTSWLRIVYPAHGQVVRGPVPISWTWGDGVKAVNVSYCGEDWKYIPVARVDCHETRGYFLFRPPGAGEYTVRITGNRCGDNVTFKVE